MNTRVSSEVTFIFTTAKKSVGVHADTEMPLHEGVSNPRVSKGTCSRTIHGLRQRPCEVKAAGGTANLPAA